MNDRIPIHRAELLAKAHGYDQVIIYARRVGEPGQEWVTTYGRDDIHSAAAARIGEAIGRQVVKSLEWFEGRATAPEQHASAQSVVGFYKAITFLTVGRSPHLVTYWNGPEGRDVRVDSFEAAKSAAQSDYETRIRSALVSGSREDGDG